MANPCVDFLTQNIPNLSARAAAAIIRQVHGTAQRNAGRFGGSYRQSLLHFAQTAHVQQMAAMANLRRVAVKDLEAQARMEQRADGFLNENLLAGESMRSEAVGVERRIKGSGDSADMTARVIQGRFEDEIRTGLEQSQIPGLYKTWLGLGSNPEMAKNVRRELWELTTPGSTRVGYTNDAKALAIAKALKPVRERVVWLEDNAGAFITSLPGYINPHQWSQDGLRLLATRPDGKIDSNYGFDQFRRIVEPEIDWLKTDDGGDRDAFLRGVWDNLHTGDHDSHMPAPSLFTLKGGLASKASANRIIHFNDAEAEIRVGDRLFEKSFKDSFISSIFSGVRRAVLMEQFGPNFEENWNAVKKRLVEKVKDRPDAEAQVASLTKSPFLEAAFSTVTGRADIPSNVKAAKWQAIFQQAVNMSSLGGSGLLSLMTDWVGAVSEIGRMGGSRIAVIGDYVKALAGASGEERRVLRSLGVLGESLQGSAGVRFGVHDKVAGRMARLEEGFHTMTGLNWTTDALRTASIATIIGEYVDRSHLDHGSLPKEFRTLLDRANISPVEWDALRSTKRKLANGREWIVPDNLDALPQAHKDALIQANGGRSWDYTKFRLETKFSAMLMDESNHMVITPTADERSIMLGGQRPGTVPGAVLRMVSQFHSFPFAIGRKLLDRAMLFDNPTRGDFIANNHWGKFRLATVVAMGTVAGYMSMTAKDLLMGRTPRTFTKDDGSFDVATLVDAMRSGGVGGLYADVALGDFHDSTGFASWLAGPLANKVSPVFGMSTKGLVEGKDISNDAYKWGMSMVPFGNHIIGRRVWDYMIGWNLQEMIDPASLQREIRALKKRTGQDYLEGRSPLDHL